MNRIKLLIVDDHQVLLDGISSIFDGVQDIAVVSTANNGHEALMFVRKNAVDVVLMDINMPIMNGVEACKKIGSEFPNIHVIALSMFQQPSYIKRMLQYGARGYLLKNDSSEDIQAAIRSVMEGGIYISGQIPFTLESIKRSSSRAKKFDDLISPREKDVLELISEGCTDQEIAQKLFISFHTANSHRKNLLSKFSAKNTAELVRKTMERGVI